MDGVKGGVLCISLSPTTERPLPSAAFARGHPSEEGRSRVHKERWMVQDRKVADKSCRAVQWPDSACEVTRVHSLLDTFRPLVIFRLFSSDLSCPCPTHSIRFSFDNFRSLSISFFLSTHSFHSFSGNPGRPAVLSHHRNMPLPIYKHVS